MKTNPILTGLIAAPFTPMHPDGTLNTGKIARYAEYLIRGGDVSGVFICGTTGESASLTTEERKAIARAWVDAAGGRLKIVVHVGGCSQNQCVELAAHAQDIGADVISAMAPYFFKPATVSDLVEFFQSVATAAPDLPFFYYNMPSITGVTLPVHRFLEEAKKRIPTLAGVKFTHNNLMEMQQCIHLGGGEFEVLHGFDEILITGLAIGAKAAVGSTYNYIPSIYRGIMQAMERCDLPAARALQWKSVKILDVVIRHGGGVRGGKMLMALAGIDCGPCRLPISPFTDREFREIREELKQTSFFETIKPWPMK
ncbi:MAG: dihydrodipicolinate synthase family protein [Rikenellaceae bacterium]|nr:dihydrodipicolinate synthase family protein [Rikenellaceae bacterium]